MLLEPNTDLSPIHWHLMETKIIKCFILTWLSRQGVVTKANVQRFSSGLSFKSCITWERFPKRSEKWKCCLIFNTITIFPWIHRNIIMMVIGLALQRSVLVQLDVSYTYSSVLRGAQHMVDKFNNDKMNSVWINRCWGSSLGLTGERRYGGFEGGARGTEMRAIIVGWQRVDRQRQSPVTTAETVLTGWQSTACYKHIQAHKALLYIHKQMSPCLRTK